MRHSWLFCFEIFIDTFCDNEQDLVVLGDTRKALLIQTKWLLSNWGILARLVATLESLRGFLRHFPALAHSFLFCLPLSLPLESIFISLQKLPSSFFFLLHFSSSFLLMFLTLFSWGSLIFIEHLLCAKLYAKSFTNTTLLNLHSSLLGNRIFSNL